MTKSKISIVIALFTSFFLISTCTTDKSITGNSDQSLGKTIGIIDINSSTHDDDESPDDFDKCLYTAVDINPGVVIFLNTSEPSDNLSVPYDFRDNFLDNSKKGIVYHDIYYKLSKYGIKNNLVNKYYKEHFELLKTSTVIAHALQYGRNADQILVNKKFSDDLTDLLKIYRSSINHKEIEPILNYLEADLEKYYNKPKYEIAADFE